MLILGINQGHDGAVALVENGRLVGAISNERISRVKKLGGVSPEMVEYVLQMAGKKPSKIDYVAISGYSPQNTNYFRYYNAKTRKNIGSLYDVPAHKDRDDCLVSVGELTGNETDIIRKGTFVQHHLAHCASAYYTSPFDQAACFSVDSSLYRPDVCSLFAYGEGNKLHSFYCPGLMIGNAYYYFTKFLGLGDGLFKAGTTMGLAAYGKANEVAKKKWKHFGESYYARHFHGHDFDFVKLMWAEIAKRAPSNAFKPEEKDSQSAMNVAASIQHIFTRTMVHFANELYQQTESFNGENICLAGGSFLNCDANSAIVRETPFKNVHLFPGCGDDGNAVGAAFYAAHTIFNEPRHKHSNAEICYLGRDYPTPGLGSPLDVEKVASVIASGKVVAWFQGGSEFGPRALGNRSLLADPRNPEMRDIINHRVKHREWFRPFAPSVLAEHCAEWFDWPGKSPFMLFTAMVKQSEKVPAISHIDGTARMQTVEQKDNPSYYALISAFHRQTGVPMLLNTSLNNNNEPLVETPNDAVNFFRHSEPIVKLLVINDRMITKEELRS